MSNDTIKFKHADDGITSVCIENTIYPAIWPLAAVDISIIRKVSGNDITYDCPTDKDGLKRLISNGMDFLEEANEANLALSLIMTDASNSDQIRRNLSELAWLQAGLAELVAKTSKSIDKMEHVLKTKKPE